jgi:small subunit ribosomal protein S20
MFLRLDTSLYVWLDRDSQAFRHRLDSPPSQGYHPRRHWKDIRVANHASAKKRAKQTVKRTARNRHIRTGVRTSVKRVRAAVEAGNPDAAKKALVEAISRIDGAVAKGIYPRKTGSRYISRLTHQVNALQS